MKNKMKEYKELINKSLDFYLTPKTPKVIWDAMRYSVLADGKRLRPILLLETAKQYGYDIKDAMPIACAFEMIHAQSLIHDDLPCMDNDDFRRGNPTNHKVFGEANAVLAGDALISFAVSTVLKHSTCDSDKKLRLIDELMTAAGVDGIISGQVVDIESEGKTISENELNYIHRYKTAAMFISAIRCGGILGGCNEEKLNILTKFADMYGLAFQIKDDILDVTATLEELGKTPNKDAMAGKVTYVTFYGLDGAIKKLNALCDDVCDIINKELNGSELLLYITDSLRVE